MPEWENATPWTHYFHRHRAHRVRKKRWPANRLWYRCIIVIIITITIIIIHNIIGPEEPVGYTTRWFVRTNRCDNNNTVITLAEFEPLCFAIDASWLDDNPSGRCLFQYCKSARFFNTARICSKLLPVRSCDIDLTANGSTLLRTSERKTTLNSVVLLLQGHIDWYLTEHLLTSSIILYNITCPYISHKCDSGGRD